MPRAAARRCLVCGSALHSHDARTRYCSTSCKLKAARKRREGKISAAIASIPDADLTRRGRLERLRDQLNAATNVAGPRELPGLARELRQTLAELDSLPSERIVTPRDEILAARARRRAGADVRARSVAGD